MHHVRTRIMLQLSQRKGMDEAKIRELIRTKYGISLGGSLGQLKGKIFRIGVMGTVGAPEIMTTVGAIGSAAAELGYKPKLTEGLSTAREILAKLPGQVA